MCNSDLVILIHGFNRSEKDMYPLQVHLRQFGYAVETVNLPTRFRSLEHCVEVFAGKFSELVSAWAETSREVGGGRIHLVGHSMGGLIIRQFLATHPVGQLGRCVMIGTPNAGSRLADLARLLFPPSLAIFPPLKCLVTDRPEFRPPHNSPPPELGIMAGSCSNLWLGFFLAKPNDGRVEVGATKLPEMQDFLVLDLHHLEIHHKPAVAELVHHFLQHGKFLVNSVD